MRCRVGGNYGSSAPDAMKTAIKKAALHAVNDFVVQTLSEEQEQEKREDKVLQEKSS